jgi:hypothetical protein
MIRFTLLKVRADVACDAASPRPVYCIAHSR